MRRGGIKTTALIIMSAIAAIIIFIAFLKATLTISYSDEVKLFVKVLIFNINILPKKDKKGPHSMSAKKSEKIRAKLNKKAEKERISAEEKKKQKAERKSSKKSLGETISNIKMFASLGILVIEKFFKHLRIKLARIKIVVASEDAATTAVAYGAITQSINVLFPALESVKNFQNLKNTDIDVRADFTKDSPEIDVKLSFSIRVWQVFDIAISALVSFIKHKFSDLSENTGHISDFKKENNKIQDKK